MEFCPVGEMGRAAVAGGAFEKVREERQRSRLWDESSRLDLECRYERLVGSFGIGGVHNVAAVSAAWSWADEHGNANAQGGSLKVTAEFPRGKRTALWQLEMMGQHWDLGIHGSGVQHIYPQGACSGVWHDLLWFLQMSTVPITRNHTRIRLGAVVARLGSGFWGAEACYDFAARQPTMGIYGIRVSNRRTLSVLCNLYGTCQLLLNSKTPLGMISVGFEVNVFNRLSRSAIGYQCDIGRVKLFTTIVFPAAGPAEWRAGVAFRDPTLSIDASAPIPSG